MASTCRRCDGSGVCARRPMSVFSASLAFRRHGFEAATVRLQQRDIAGEVLPALDRDVHVGGVDLDRVHQTAGHFARDDRRARSAERLVYCLPGRGTKAAVTRDQVYAFAWGCIEHGEPEAAAAAVICFEWLQRPENVLSGYLRWSDYRSKDWPSAIKIEHHKTGAVVWHPLEDMTDSGVVRFYEDAEAILFKLPRRGIPMILREVREGITKPFSFGGMQKIVQTMRAKLGLTSTFTLDACRHGGMTELEEAELTDGQGRALSAHKSQQAYEGYAKRTMERALSATRKRHAHRLTNASGTNIQNGGQNDVQNGDSVRIKFSR